jgi:tungstate transport system ATP-binding protein
MADVLQQPLLCRMSVFHNVALGLRFRRRPRREIELRVGEWLERFQIAHLRDRPAQQISGGEAQRASLARAFVLDPEILILDEPFAALDAPTREALLDDLGNVLAETRTTTLFATHDRDEALAVGDRLAVLAGGRVVQIGTPEEVFSRPASQEVARFVGVENRISGRVVAIGEGCVRVDVGVGILDVRGHGKLGDAVLVCARPEDVEIVTGTEAVTPPAPNSLDGTVTRLSPLESQVRVHVDAGFAITVLVTKSSLRNSKLAVGAGARCVFPEPALHLVHREEEPQ